MPSASEIIRKHGIPKTLHVSRDTNQATEPKSGALSEALRLREEIIGARMLQSTADDLDSEAQTKRARQAADLADAKARELEATIKLEEIRSKSDGSNGAASGAPSPLLVMLNEMIGTMQSQNQALLNEVRETREGTVSQAITALRDEIASLKGQAVMQGATHARSDSVENFLERIEDVKKGMELLKGLGPGMPEMTGLQGDFQTLLMIRKMNDDMILRMEEIRDRREQTTWDRHMETERFGLEERRSQRMAQTIEQALPTISALAYDRLGVTPPAAPETVNHCPDQACSGALILSQDRSKAFCTSCGTTYQTKEQ